MQTVKTAVRLAVAPLAMEVRVAHAAMALAVVAVAAVETVRMLKMALRMLVEPLTIKVVVTQASCASAMVVHVGVEMMAQEEVNIGLEGVVAFEVAGQAVRPAKAEVQAVANTWVRAEYNQPTAMPDELLQL